MARKLRTLRLVTGARYMEGDDVLMVQRALNAQLPDKLWPDLLADGEYGPATAAHVAMWKRYVAGYPDSWLRDGLAQAIGPKGQQWMLGRSKLPATWRAVGVARQQAWMRNHQPDVAQRMRQRAVETMTQWAHDGWAERDGNNVVPELVALATKLGVHRSIDQMGYAWCALAAFTAALQAGGKTAYQGLVQYRFNALYTPTILQLAGEGRYGMRVVGRSQAARGDLVMFNWPTGHPLVDHVGRLRSANAMLEDIETAEGNISNRMVLETRSITTVRAFIRDT